MWAIDSSGHGITDEGFDRTSLLEILDNLREDIVEMAAGKHRIISDPEANWRLALIALRLLLSRRPGPERA